MTLHGLLFYTIVLLCADMKTSGCKTGCGQKKRKKAPGQKEKCSVKTLTWISSQEAAVVVKMFVVADCSVINALSTSNAPNTSFRHDCGGNVKLYSEIKMSWSHGEGFVIKERKTTIKYTAEYNLYRSKKLKTVTLNNMIVMLPSSQSSYEKHSQWSDNGHDEDDNVCRRTKASLRHSNKSFICFL